MGWFLYVRNVRHEKKLNNEIKMTTDVFNEYFQRISG